jgi:tetratricopeptide (TPR) repeat protein
MPKQLSIYTLDEFKQGSFYDRLIMAEVEPNRFELTDREEKRYRDMKEAFALVHDTIETSVAIKKIREHIPRFEGYSEAKKLYDDVIGHYGRFLDVNKQYRKALVIERMYRIAQMLEEEGKLDEAINAFMKAAQIDGLDKMIDTTKPQDLRLPEFIKMTSNPAVLRLKEN